MFRFTAQGRIGVIQELKSNTLKLALAADRIIEGKSNTWTATEWLYCVSFDPNLNRQMLTDLEKGQMVTLEGRIVPTVREHDGQKVYDHTFEITRFQKGAKPKTSSRSKAPEEPAETPA